mmetsp:Transcript_5231/g.10818  ORF Transcript_5231/g.10818 Transcript_5231/m.10818 type:complete len:300 (-) Transcript_5231:873-1772(-)
MMNTSRTTSGGAEVRLGGAWSAQREREQGLEEAVSLLRSELAAVQGLLRQEVEITTALRKALAARDDEIKFLETSEAIVREELENTRGIAQADADRKDVLEAANLELKRQIEELRNNMLAAERRATQAEADAIEAKLREDIAEAEVQQLQNQYDAAEARAEDADRKSEEALRHVELMAKAKSQKERQIETIAKDRDRALADLKIAKAELAKARIKRTSRATLRSRGENIDPNPSVVSKLTKEEKTNLARFSASNRLKEDLAQEKALRQLSDQEAAKLRRENQALKIRYRNFTNAANTYY